MISESKFKEIFGSGQRMTKEYLNSAEGLTKRRKVWEFLRTVEGMQSYSRFCEAMGTSDFSYLLTADMNAQLLEMQKAVDVSYPLWTRQVRVNDFKSTPLPAASSPITVIVPSVVIAFVARVYWIRDGVAIVSSVISSYTSVASRT